MSESPLSNVSEDDWSLHLSQTVLQSCLLEVRSEKPGNVSPSHQFDDIDIRSFEESAAAVSLTLASPRQKAIGQSILNSIAATQQAVGSNTNLGIVLLLAPLTAVPQASRLLDGIEGVLAGLTVQDAVDTFEAIRIASPAGLGEAESQDVTSLPTEDLRKCMILAADRDLIARQYENGFREVLHDGLGWLIETCHWKSSRQFRIGWLAVKLMSHFGDSLIARKCGQEISQDVAKRATKVLSSGWPQAEGSGAVYDEFDRFLREDGNQRNPGTTADMIAAILFAAIRDGYIAADSEVRSFDFLPQ